MVAIICEKMHWSYNDYMDAPDWLIETILIKMQVDSANAEEQLKKAKK